MQQAVSQQTAENFRNDFYFRSTLPENISFLETLSWNFYWSWNDLCLEVFRSLGPRIWDEHEQNPRQVLKNINELHLWQKANNANFVRWVNQIEKDFEAYMNEPAKDFGKITAKNPVAYFCAEYGVHSSLPIYSGGLGILAGDHLKSASDLNFPLVAVGLLYRYGYFKQKIADDGWQKENYVDVFNSELALKPVLNENSERVLISVRMRGRSVHVQAWLAQIGKVPLYLLDTNVVQNETVDRLITGHLYGGNSETRLVQEKILGIGGIRLLDKLGIYPSVYHLNEGHSAFLALELSRKYLEKSNKDSTFGEIASLVRGKCVFTTHTPVDAGNDSFSPELIENCFDRKFIASLKLEKKDLFSLGRTNPSNLEEWFGMTPLAIRMARSTNGVSKRHGEVSRNLWKKMFWEASEAENVPITHVTNGVHPQTWISPVLKSLYEEQMGKNWTKLLSKENQWKAAVAKLDGGMIWERHQTAKNLLIAFLREKYFQKNTDSEDVSHKHTNTIDLFDESILTIGFARRVAAYKRWNLLITDVERLLKVAENSERPIQFVFAGKAHPQDRKAKKILQNMMSINTNSNLQNRAVFIEDYDQEVARYLVQGVDVWMNVPRRPLEASGTSGQKAAMNGVLNFSVLDGWWIEGFNGKNGFSIGMSNEIDDLGKDEIDARDAESLYLVLENEITPTYYDRDESGLPIRWISFMKNAIATLTTKFSSDRMLKDYIERIYN